MSKAKEPAGVRGWRGPGAPHGSRARGPLIKRWIGAARRRATRMRRDETGEAAEIITLTWAQTFGKPSPAPRRGGDEGGSAPTRTIVLASRR